MRKIYIFLLVIAIILFLVLLFYLGLFLRCLIRYYNMKKRLHHKNILDKKINFLYDKKKHNNIIKLFKKLLFVLNKYKLDWWMMGGSLLGVKRHKGFIPWDDDLDIGITEDSINKLKNIPFKKYGLFLRATKTYAGNYYQLYFIKDKDRPYVDEVGGVLGFSNNSNLDTIFIDIFPFVLNKDKWTPTAFKNQTFLNKNLFPLKKENFHNIKVNVPNNYLPYLNKLYKKWDKKAKIYLPHSAGLICPVFCLSTVKITPQIQKLFYEHSENAKY